MALIFGAALLVSGAIVWASVRSLREDGSSEASHTAD
jgi:hypothetical protein